MAWILVRSLVGENNVKDKQSNRDKQSLEKTTCRNEPRAIPNMAIPYFHLMLLVYMMVFVLL